MIQLQKISLIDAKDFGCKPCYSFFCNAIAFYICRRLKKVEFENNESELVSIERNAFADSRIEELTLPSNITYLSEGWCNDMSWLKSIKIIPYSKVNIAFYNEKMLLGKSDLKSDVFNISAFFKQIFI